MVTLSPGTLQYPVIDAPFFESAVLILTLVLSACAGAAIGGGLAGLAAWKTYATSSAVILTRRGIVWLNIAGPIIAVVLGLAVSAMSLVNAHPDSLAVGTPPTFDVRELEDPAAIEAARWEFFARLAVYWGVQGLVVGAAWQTALSSFVYLSKKHYESVSGWIRQYFSGG